MDLLQHHTGMSKLKKTFPHDLIQDLWRCLLIQVFMEAKVFKNSDGQHFKTMEGVGTHTYKIHLGCSQSLQSAQRGGLLILFPSMAAPQAETLATMAGLPILCSQLGAEAWHPINGGETDKIGGWGVGNFACMKVFACT